MVDELSIPGFVGTYWYDIKEKGTSYEVQRVTPRFAATKDPSNRPTAMTFGAGGAMFFLDFSSSVIENNAYSRRGPGSDDSRARVWRITCTPNPLLQSSGIVGRPSRVLLYWHVQIDNAVDWLAQLVEDEHNWVRMEVVPACGFSPSGRAQEVALQRAGCPMDAGMKKAMGHTMDIIEGSGSLRP